MFLNLADFIKSHSKSIMYVLIGLFILALVGLFVVFFVKQTQKKNKGDAIRHMTTIAIFSTISVILYETLKFSLPIFPSFLKVNFSNLPILLGGFLLGPVEGMMIIVIRTVIALPSTGTFCVGEIADVIISSSILFVSTAIYNKNKTRKGAIIALVSSMATWVIVGALANYFILLPAYVQLFFGGNVEAFLPLLKVIPNVTATNYTYKYVLFGACPFNLMLSTVVCLVTFFVYKRLSMLFHYFDKKIYVSKNEDENEEEVEKVEAK